MSSTLIYNAKLLSFSEKNKRGQDSLLIEKNRIRAIGSYEELKSVVDTNTHLINAAGKSLLPGFNDSHIHIWKVGSLKTFMLDLRGVKSLEEMLSMLSDYDKKYPDTAWITARGFNEASWADGRMPTHFDLDRVTKNKPVYVIRTCAHIAVANARAMEIAHVNKDTLIPAGGEMHMGPDGLPNGVFTETALGLISNYIPAFTKDELKKMVLVARDEMYRYGITAVTDPAVDPLLLESYYEMNRDGELGFR